MVLLALFKTGRPLKIEIVHDGGPDVVGQPSLLNRIAGMPKVQTVKVGGVPPKYLSSCRLVLHMLTSVSLRQIMAAPVAVAPAPPRRVRQKKGPKRLKKRLAGYANARPAPTSKEDLDKEMDEYRAEAEALA